jgi:hypothetical protein
MKGLNRDQQRLAVAGAGGLGAGLLLGYALAQVRLRKRFEQRLSSEIEAIREYYAGRDEEQIRKAVITHYQSFLSQRPGASEEGERPSAVGGQPPALSGVVPRSYGPDHAGLGSVESVTEMPGEPGPDDDYPPGHPLEGVEGHPENHGDDDDDDDDDGPEPDPDSGLETRNEPYLITVQQFEGERTGYEKFAMTYYAGDDVLVDPSDNPLRAEEAIRLCGVGYASNFGQPGMPDPHTIFVRNDKNEVDLEISWDGRSFGEVLGFRNARRTE